MSETLGLAFPLVISFLSMTVMGIVDTFIVGKIGTAEQGGVGMGATLFWTILSLFTGTMTATSTFVAQSYGAEKHELIKRWVMAALWLIPPMSLIMWLFIPIFPYAVDLMATTEEVRPHVVPYMTIRLIGAPFIIATIALSGFLRGLGDMKTPMIITVIVNLVNIFLDVILVFGYGPIPEMGVEGAAWATVAASGLSAALYLRVYLGKNYADVFGTRSWVWVKKEELLQFLKIGLPIGGSWIIESISWALMTIYVASIDPEGLAAHIIVFTIIHFSFMPAVAFSIAASTLVGQYLGAERIDLAKRSANKAIISSMMLMGIFGIFFVVSRGRLIALFNPDPAVVEMGSVLLLIAAGFQLLDAIGIAISGILKGAGDTRYPLYVQIGAAWFVFAPMIFILGQGVGWGVYGAWIAALVFISQLGLLLLLRYVGGKWQHSRVL